MMYDDLPEYPTTDELEEVASWDMYNFLDKVERIRELWAYPNYVDLREKEDEYQLHLSTGGWSGNESLIDAMENAPMFWHSYWYSSTRGGHYVFTCDKIRAKEWVKSTN